MCFARRGSEPHAAVAWSSATLLRVLKLDSGTTPALNTAYHNL